VNSELDPQVLGAEDTFLNIIRTVKDLVSLSAVIDILIVAALFYIFYLFLRQTRALGIIYGILVLAALWLISHYLELNALRTILRWLLTSILVAIPVVFQPELRSALEKLGRSTKYVTDWKRLSRFEIDIIVEELIQSLNVLSKNRIGALIVLSRQSNLGDVISTGVKIYANLNNKLLTNIFTPKAPLHDGAVIISANKIIAAACTLPISDEVIDLSLGTRHKAAMSLTGMTDAIAIVVSEETGMVSLSVNGRIQRNLNFKELKEYLIKHLTSRMPLRKLTQKSKR
jgi:diadenylate cyclase